MKSLKYLLIFSSLALAIMLIDIDITATNLLLSNIMRDLSLSLSNAQWIIDGYTAAAAALMAFGGVLADRVGYKKVFIGGLITFITSSAVIAISQESYSLIIGRIIQGGSIAFIFPVCAIIVRDVFPVRQQNLAMGALISIAGISQAIGPSVGGIIVHFANWRWLFILNIPLGIASLLFIYSLIEPQKAAKKANIKWLPLILLSAAIASFTTAINEIGNLAYGITINLLLLIASVACCYIFIKKEWNDPEPLLALKLLVKNEFSILLSLRFLINFIYFGWLFTISLFLQRSIGFSALESGSIMLVMTLLIAILSTPVSTLLSKSGVKSILKAGLFFMLCANLLFIILSLYHPLWLIFAGLFSAGISAALLIPTTAVGAMNSIPIEKTGAGMGMIFTCGFIGSTASVAIMGLMIKTPDALSVGFGFCSLIAVILSLLGFYLASKLK